MIRPCTPHLGADRGAVVDVHLGLGVAGDGLRVWSGREKGDMRHATVMHAILVFVRYGV